MRARNWLWVLILLAAVAVSTQGQGAPEATDDSTDSTDWTDCLSCHEISGDDLPTLADLRISTFGARLQRDCLECHDRVDLTGINNIWLHETRPLAAHVDCLLCHTAGPHSADNPPKPAHWGKKDEEQCYTCHRTIELDMSQQYTHGFAPGVRCRSCHEPHEPFDVAIPESLLTGDLADLRGSSYDWRESNRACLTCHSETQLTLSLSDGFVTLNTVNYHDVHLEQGNTMCIECHNPHGSLRPGMLRSRLLTGELFGYSEDPSGGTCAVRCHGVEHDDWTYRNRPD